MGDEIKSTGGSVVASGFSSWKLNVHYRMAGTQC